MKFTRIIFPLLLMAIICSKAYCQEIAAFVHENNYWYQYGEYLDLGSSELQVSHHTYFFDGDTTINEITYQKMMRIRDDTLYGDPMIVWDGVSYQGAFRQIENEVYFVKKEEVEESLYIDFNLSVGDTLKYHYDNSGIKTVISVDSVAFGPEYRNVYRLSNGLKIYEGIGNELGLFKGFGFGVEGGTYLVCFQQADFYQEVSFFPDPPICRLDILSNVYEINDISQVSIVPNPFSDYAKIKGNALNNVGYNLVLYNSQGQEVRRKRGFCVEWIDIEKGELTSGVYYFQIATDRNERLVGKLMVK